MDTQQLQMFRAQIREDIENITEQWKYVDHNLEKPEYGFNYWVLSRIYNIDEEIIPQLVTEYSDKGIDCYVHFEENKELFLIQNKYYAENTPISRSDVTDFLDTPLSLLKNNSYYRSQELQNIFNKIIEDPDYKVSLYFFSTSNNTSEDIKQLIRNFNTENHGLKCLINASFIDLQLLYELYYGKNYSQTISFTYPLGTINKGTFASLREEYGIESLYEAYYIVTPVVQIYKMLLAAEKREYQLFERNIREYLGDNVVNNGIVDTLRNPSERKNFMYYNNGITVICQRINASHPDSQSGLRIIPLVNPQIVNGCQTVSSIKKVLENVSAQQLENDFKNVFVMLKALVIDNPEDFKNKQFYSNVVKFTNKQNAISEKAFVSNIDVFYRLQSEFEKRGFLLLVKPSDKNTFKQSLNQKEKADLIKNSNRQIYNLGFETFSFSDLLIPLEKLLQVFIAFIKSGHYAFTKKNMVLKQGGELFDQYCSEIQNYLTIDNMINLYIIYKKAETERKSSEDKRTPIPYYVIGFLGELIDRTTPEAIQESLNYIFSDKSVCAETYKYLVAISKNYKRTYMKFHTEAGEGEYNVMIKRPIDEKAFQFSVETVNDVGSWNYIKRWSNYGQIN